MSALSPTDVLVVGAAVVGFMLGILAAYTIDACNYWLSRRHWTRDWEDRV